MFNKLEKSCKYKKHSPKKAKNQTMKKISLIIVIALSIWIFKCNAQQSAITSENGLVDYLKSNWQTPEDYVIKKFENHEDQYLVDSLEVNHTSTIL